VRSPTSWCTTSPLKDLGDKVDGSERAKVESALSDLRGVPGDGSGIDKKGEAARAANAVLQQAASAGRSGRRCRWSGRQRRGRAVKANDDAVDAEFEEVKEEGVLSRPLLDWVPGRRRMSNATTTKCSICCAPHRGRHQKAYRRLAMVAPDRNPGIGTPGVQGPKCRDPRRGRQTYL
jgi:hypothetical protein